LLKRAETIECTVQESSESVTIQIKAPKGRQILKRSRCDQCDLVPAENKQFEV
jgi:hypothetical protein